MLNERLKSERDQMETQSRKAMQIFQIKDEQIESLEREVWSCLILFFIFPFLFFL